MTGGTWDLWDKCWGAGGVSDISLLTQPPPQTRVKWETQTLALWPADCTVQSWSFSRPFFLHGPPPWVVLIASSHTVSSERRTYGQVWLKRTLWFTILNVCRMVNQCVPGVMMDCDPPLCVCCTVGLLQLLVYDVLTRPPCWVQQHSEECT